MLEKVVIMVRKEVKTATSDVKEEVSEVPEFDDDLFDGLESTSD